MRDLIVVISFLTLAALACNFQNNDDLPTLVPTLPPPNVTIATAVPAATKPNATAPAPAATQPAQPTPSRPANTAAVQPTATSAAQLDKGDELDKLLDELNNALKNFDTMDDVK